MLVAFEGYPADQGQSATGGAEATPKQRTRHEPETRDGFAAFDQCEASYHRI